MHYIKVRGGILKFYRYVIVSFKKYMTEDLLVTRSEIVSSDTFNFAINKIHF